MIDRQHELPVTHQAKLLNVSRGSVYYLPKPPSQVDLALMRRIDELRLKHPFMGARMLRDQLALEELHVGRRHIGTLNNVGTMPSSRTGKTHNRTTKESKKQGQPHV